MKQAGYIQDFIDSISHLSMTTQIYTRLNFHYLAMEYDRTHPRAYRKEKSISHVETELMLSH